MEKLLIHKCTIQTRTGTENDFGEQTYSYADTYTNVKCRLSTPSGSMRRLPSGEFVTGTPKLFLKPDETVSETDRIKGTTGFTDTYEILKVNDIFNGRIKHHLELNLGKVI